MTGTGSDSCPLIWHKNSPYTTYTYVPKSGHALPQLVIGAHGLICVIVKTCSLLAALRIVCRAWSTQADNLLRKSHRWFSARLQGWGQFRNWNWNWCQFQFQELELQRNWIKGIGIGIDKEELKELIQFLFLIVNSFWFFAMFLAESLNQFDLKPFWIQLTRISLDRYIILYDNLSIKWILHGSYWLHL